MTEAEWFASAEPWFWGWSWHPPTAPPYPHRLNSDRVQRLFAVACARRVAHLDPDPRLDEAIAAAERHVDARSNEDRRRLRTIRAALYAEPGWFETPLGGTVTALVNGSGSTAQSHARLYIARLVRAAGLDGGEEQLAQARLYRDVVGNPFQLEAFDPGWRTETAVALARGMYDGRDFGIMPVLADALDDAGCDQPDILAHCRDRDAAHVRGCWVVDLVLDKR